MRAVGEGGDEGVLSDGELSDASTCEGGQQLFYGSADPHGCGDVDRARRRRRAVPCPLREHVQASCAELREREFPRACEAPATVVEDVVSALPIGPWPLVTRVEQVIPTHTLRLVRAWMRRLRRCLRAARRGDASLARRMRPDDLWLAHELHSVEATAAWPWDLRPLLHGGPAVPFGWETEGPDTGVALEAWLADAAGFVDAAIVAEVVRGVGDDSQCRRGTLLCAPHAGALERYDVAAGKLLAGVEAGWCECSAVLPCWPLRTSPYSVVDESERAGRPKFRLTTDLSWPLRGSMWDVGGEVDSVNAAMDRSRWPENPLVRVRQVAEAAAILHGGGDGRRVRLWSLDCEAFYRQVGRRRAELWRNAVLTADGVQLDRRCCFGDAAAATKCARVSNYLVWQMRRALQSFDDAHPAREAGWVQWQGERRALGLSAALFWAAIYIDDTAAASADDLLFGADGAPVCGSDGVQQRRAAAHFAIARGVLERYGWASAPSKEQPPGTRLEVLGVELDMDTWRMNLSEGKCTRYGNQARTVAALDRCSRADFEQLLGRLQFATQCHPVARQRLHSCWRLARASFRLSGGDVRLPAAVRGDLRWWAELLGREGGVGVPLAATALRDDWPAIYADASGSIGFAAWAVLGDEMLYVVGEWSADERERLIIADLEFLASTFGLVALAPLLGGRVTSFTDNVVAEAAMRAAAPRTAAMQWLSARRAAWILAAAAVEGVARVTSANNRWADLGSRGAMRQAMDEAMALGLWPRRVAVPREWRDTTAMLAAA